MERVSYWIALSETPGISIAAMRSIYESLTATGLSIQDIAELGKEELEAEFSFPAKVNEGIVASQAILEEIEEVYHDILDAHIRPILFFESLYPNALKSDKTIQAPPLLYAFGNSSLLTEPAIAVTASSDASTKAEPICYQAARLLSEHNTPVINGLNRGSGSLIASATLENKGKLLGVIPCGLLQFSISEDLQKMFDPERDLIVSPFFPKAAVTKHQALYRNELICSLSRAIYVVEMAEDDEVLNATVKHASKKQLPLYTTEFAEYPPEARGNQRILQEFGGKAVRGKKSGNLVIPNIDALLAHAKFKLE